MQPKDKNRSAVGMCASVNTEDLRRVDEFMTTDELQNVFSLSEIVYMVRENVLQD